MNSFRELIFNLSFFSCPRHSLRTTPWATFTLSHRDKNKPKRGHTQRAILVTCELWDIDYNSHNWEKESQHSLRPFNKSNMGQRAAILQCLLFLICECQCKLQKFFSNQKRNFSKWKFFILRRLSQCMNIFIRGPLHEFFIRGSSQRWKLKDSIRKPFRCPLERRNHQGSTCNCKSTLLTYISFQKKCFKILW